MTDPTEHPYWSRMNDVEQRAVRDHAKNLALQLGVSRKLHSIAHAIVSVLEISRESHSKRKIPKG